MWTTNHRQTTKAAPEAVWAALEKLHSGTPLGPNSHAFELHGPFEAGTRLTTTPRGQEPVQSRIIEVAPGRVYADSTVLGELELIFRHELTPTADGGTTVTHTLVIDGPGVDRVGPKLGPQISSDFPIAMSELLAAAETMSD